MTIPLVGRELDFTLLRSTFDKLGVWSRLELAMYVATHGGSAWAEAGACAPERQAAFAVKISAREREL